MRVVVLTRLVGLSAQPWKTVTTCFVPDATWQRVITVHCELRRTIDDGHCSARYVFKQPDVEWVTDPSFGSGILRYVLRNDNILHNNY